MNKYLFACCLFLFITSCTKQKPPEEVSPNLIKLEEVQAQAKDTNESITFKFHWPQAKKLQSRQIIQTIIAFEELNKDIPDQKNTIEIVSEIDRQMVSTRRTQFEEEFLTYKTNFQLGDDTPIIQDLSEYFKSKKIKYTLDSEKKNILITGLTNIRDDLNKSLPETMKSHFLDSLSNTKIKDLIELRHFLFFNQKEFQPKDSVKIKLEEAKSVLELNYLGSFDLNGKDISYFETSDLKLKHSIKGQDIDTHSKGRVAIEKDTGLPYFYEMKSESQITFTDLKKDEEARPKQVIQSTHQMIFEWKDDTEE